MRFAAASLVFLAATFQAVSAAEWQVFSPPDKSFSVSVPGKMQSMTVQTSQGPRALYRCAAGEVNYLVNVSNIAGDSEGFEEFVSGVDKGLRLRGGSSCSVRDASGKGWRGKTLDFSFGPQKRTTTTAAANEALFAEKVADKAVDAAVDKAVDNNKAKTGYAFYTLSVNLPAMDVDTNRFIRSFELRDASILKNAGTDAKVGPVEGQKANGKFGPVEDQQANGKVGPVEDQQTNGKVGAVEGQPESGKSLGKSEINIILPTISVVVLIGFAFYMAIQRRKR